eukprot:2535849-Prymnesium_polylepis.1
MNGLTGGSPYQCDGSVSRAPLQPLSVKTFNTASSANAHGNPQARKTTAFLGMAFHQAYRRPLARTFHQIVSVSANLLIARPAFPP